MGAVGVGVGVAVGVGVGVGVGAGSSSAAATPAGAATAPATTSAVAHLSADIGFGSSLVSGCDGGGWRRASKRIALQEPRDLAVGVGLVRRIQVAGVRPQRQLRVRDRLGEHARVL